MKNYKHYQKASIGASDFATLTVRVCESKDMDESNIHNWGLFNLNFGKDGAYDAYIVDGNAEIGSHYRKVIEGINWLKIYDDEKLAFTVSGAKINIYRSGEMGCIIQIIQ